MSRILVINAVNIFASGGGNTHLRELLSHADPLAAGFAQVKVIAPKATLDRLPDFEWLGKITHPWLNKSLLHRYLFLYFRLNGYLQPDDVLFSPAGDYNGRFPRQVAMTQNQLYYEPRERFRYFPGPVFFRLLILQYLQYFAFRRSRYIIALTQYGAEKLHSRYGFGPKIRIVPHGSPAAGFAKTDDAAHVPEVFSVQSPMRLLYVSVVDMYKHQWVVGEAVKELHDKGLHLKLDLVGPVLYKPAGKKLQRFLEKTDEAVVQFHGAVPYESVGEFYSNADLFVFASSCENLPIILLEAAKAGLPVLCYDYPPAREILDKGAAWFSELDAGTIAHKIELLYRNPELRRQIAEAGQERARLFSWEKCAQQTFQLLAEVAG